jgi:hypothetical protein
LTWRAPYSAPCSPIGIASPSHTHFGQNDPPPVAAHSSVTAVAMMPETMAWTARAWWARRIAPDHPSSGSAKRWTCAILNSSSRMTVRHPRVEA